MRGARPFAALEADLAARVAMAAGETLVVATSGGPDSVALAALLAPLARECGGTLVLAHVNANLRATGWQDEAVVLSLGAALGVRVVAVSLDHGRADEARLRDERYAALERIARDACATRIVTAHHAGDQTETVLLALLRGSGPDGLTGMEPERTLASGTIVLRPLLGCEPETLRAYVAAHHLPYAADATNGDLTYRRNAVRAALATLRPSFPHLDAAVARCAAILREEREGLPRAQQRARLREAVVEATGDARDLSFERLDAAARALERGTPGRHFLRRGVELVVE